MGSRPTHSASLVARLAAARPRRVERGGGHVGYTVLRPEDQSFEVPSWRPEEPVRRLVEIPLHANMQHSRAHLWKYPAGAAGRRHKPVVQEEIFFVHQGTFTMLLGDESERFELPARQHRRRRAGHDTQADERERRGRPDLRLRRARRPGRGDPRGVAHRTSGRDGARALRRRRRRLGVERRCRRRSAERERGVARSCCSRPGRTSPTRRSCRRSSSSAAASAGSLPAFPSSTGATGTSRCRTAIACAWRGGSWSAARRW